MKNAKYGIWDLKKGGKRTPPMKTGNISPQNK
jgi:hypothetical protein